MKKYPLHKTCIATHIRGDASSRYFVIDMRINPEDIRSGQVLLFDNELWYVSDCIWMNGGYVLIIRLLGSMFSSLPGSFWSTWNFDRI